MYQSPLSISAQHPYWGTLHVQVPEGQPRVRGELAGQRGRDWDERGYQICGQESTEIFFLSIIVSHENDKAQ